MSWRSSCCAFSGKRAEYDRCIGTSASLQSAAAPITVREWDAGSLVEVMAIIIVPWTDLVWTMRNVHPTSSFLLQRVSLTTRQDQVAIVSSAGVLFVDAGGQKVGIVVSKAIVVCGRGKESSSAHKTCVHIYIKKKIHTLQ